VVGAQLREGFAKARGVGGLYVLSYHSQLLARPEYVPTLAAVVREIAADSAVWLATGADVARWWLARATLELRASRCGERFDVEVRNPSRHDVENAVIRIALPRGFRVRASSAPLLTASEAGIARVRVRHLPGRSATTVRLALSPS
jgi:hypothetical protein